MSVVRIGRWKVWAAAVAATLVGVTLPTVAATPAGATTTAYDSTYYKNAVGKTGTSLKSSLHTIISSQSKISYDAVWNALKVADQDPGNTNNVILLYSGTSRSKSLNGGDVGDWNREHTWAQSTATSAPRPARAPICTTCVRRTSRSTASAATRTSTTAAARSAVRPAATRTATRSSRATPTRATWPA